MKITKQQIKEWNEYFTSLSPAKKRVAIAKDVIEQVKAERYLAKNRTYIDFLMKFDGQIQSKFDKVKCQCCALGAMFLSDVKYTNNCTIEDLDRINFSREEENRLQNYFDIEQLILIEAAFECWGFETITEFDGCEEDYRIIEGFGYDVMLSDLSLTSEDIDKAAQFGYQYDDNSERLIAIMRNIIKNRGKFKL